MNAFISTVLVKRRECHVPKRYRLEENFLDNLVQVLMIIGMKIINVAGNSERS